MTPLEYEIFVGQHFIAKGYSVDLTPQSNDYGVDLFATKGSHKVAVQVKMYGQFRKINRKAIMELFGAKVFFDCTSAKIVTDGVILKDAVEVAKKLNIEILNIVPDEEIKAYEILDNNERSDFYLDWETHIQPLIGKTLYNSRNKPNKIISVDFGGVSRITENGKVSKIPIEIFKESYYYAKQNGEVTRDYINQNYVGRASSGVILILSQIPTFELLAKPLKLIVKK